jgi:hypothetical protein
MNLTYESFVDFVANQPNTKRINHSSWDTCAAGEWLRSVNIDTSELDPTKDYTKILLDSGMPEHLYDHLNSSEIDLDSYPELDGYDIEKYGDLHKLIQEWYPCSTKTS